MHKATHSSHKNTTRPFILSRDPNKALEETMRTIERLQGLYQKENAALDKSDTKGFLALQDIKVETARLYHDSVSEIIARKDEMQTASAELKQRLRAMQEGFSEIAAKNLKAVSRMQRTVERLGDTIRRAARDSAKQQNTSNYGKSGQLENNSKRPTSMGLSETA